MEKRKAKFTALVNIHDDDSGGSCESDFDNSDEDADFNLSHECG